MDNRTKEQRRKNMQNIKQKDTSIELTLRKALWRKGYRYRKNYEELPGRPDIVFTKQKIVVFCDSEFWHGKDWDVLKPKMMRASNADFWVKKIERTIERDKEVDQKLLYLGWTVIHFWGKEIMKNTDECIRVIEETIFENMINVSSIDDTEKNIE